MKIAYVVDCMYNSGGMERVLSVCANTLCDVYDVTVITPRYKEIRQNLEYVQDFKVNMHGKSMDAIIRKHVQKVKDRDLVTLVVDNAYYVDRDGMYCHSLACIQQYRHSICQDSCRSRR